MGSGKARLQFDARISRRDFLNGISVGVGGALLGSSAPGIAVTEYAASPHLPAADWYGFGGVGDYRTSHGNTPALVSAAHRVRDGEFRSAFDDVAVSESVDLVIVGAGMAGFGAALEFAKNRKTNQSCLMLDNHPVFGGEAKENEFDVNGTRLIAPQGANGFFIPPEAGDVDSATGDPRYYAELGIPREFELRDWPADLKELRFCPDNYEYLVRGLQEATSVGHWFPDGTSAGHWAIDMWQRKLENTTLSASARSALTAWYQTGATRKFESTADAVRTLDSMSYEQFLVNELGLGIEGARYADLFLASACGLGSDAVSAYAAYRNPMPGFIDTPPPDLRRSSFPGGNSGFARYFVKKLIPDAISGPADFENIITGRIDFRALDRQGMPFRIRLGATAVSVGHEGPVDGSDNVKVVYEDRGKLRAIRCKALIMATGGWMNRHVVRDLPEDIAQAYATFVHAPFLVANVALTNWRFLYRLGITAAIWNRDDGVFGYTCNIRNPMQVGKYRPPLDPDLPTVLSFYTPFYYPGLPIQAQVAKGRTELLLTSYSEYEKDIRAQMLALFASSGFSPDRDVAGVILNRWGHAYSVPIPGFFGGKSGSAPRDLVRRGYGRIAFGHSELDGLQHYGPAADEGRRAFTQISALL